MLFLATSPGPPSVIHSVIRGTGRKKGGHHKGGEQEHLVRAKQHVKSDETGP